MLVKALSEEQKKLRLDIEANQDKKQRDEKKKARNEILNRLHKEIQKEERRKIAEKIEEIERFKEDSNRMYQVVKQLQPREKKKILVDSEHGVTSNDKQQIKIITEHFKKVFHRCDQMEIEHIKPKEMKTQFTKEEVAKAIRSLKNNKSPGIDDIKAELIKYSPGIIHEKISDIFNEIAKTGETPEEMIEGILVPLPKPGKKLGPPANLRPVILLSTLRKILAICMIRRLEEKINSKIPLSQAAYRRGRSTTEHVFTCKVLAEKAITSMDYEVTILLLDMSKAFDTVKRNMLMKQLKEILDEDELHIMKVLLTDVRLKVRIGKELGKEIVTNIGVPQGDCLSPILFTLYLANALSQMKERSKVEIEHNYSKLPRNIEEDLPDHLHDHIYSKQRNIAKIIDQQYTDDIGWVGINSKFKIGKIKKEIPEKLSERNLNVNKEKTEEYNIRRNESVSWKKCKYLGSLLDTEEDIKRRKGLAISTCARLTKMLENKVTSLRTKVRIVKVYIESVFMYNAELWTLTKQLEKEIDVFQRKLLRRIFNIRWQDMISNEDLYRRCKMEPWSKIIKKRRLSWYGHLIRLSEETPAKKALEEVKRKVKKPKGGQKITWIKLIEKDLKDLKRFVQKEEDLEEITLNRKRWRKLIHCGMLDLSDGNRN